MNAPAPAAVPIANEDPDREVWELLGALHLLRAHLWLGLRNQASHGPTVLIAVDPEQGHFLVDALRDAPELAAGDRLYFDTQVEGRRLRFECRLDQILNLDGGLAYQLDAPRLVLDQQRRQAYRVRVPATLRLPAAIQDGLQRTPARVLDLSTRGCSTRTESMLALEDGDRVRVQLHVGETVLSCAARIRNVQRLPGGARLGMEFELDPRADLHTLESTVARLQREILRRRAG